MSRQTFAHIRLDALRHNLAQVRQRVGQSRILSVVKGDAYGHGLEQVVDALADSDALAVATIGEAHRVRRSGWRGPLVLLEGCSNSDELARAFALDAEMVIHSSQQIEQLAELVRERPPAPQRYWLKLDSGMNRLGFGLDEAARRYQQLLSMDAVSEVVLMSHFAAADLPDDPLNQQQLQDFHAATRDLPGPRSLANSAAILNFPESHADWVRPGLMLYGVSPLSGQTGADLGLRPAMRLACELIAHRQCRAGDRVGYGGHYHCPEDMPVGIAGIGYADGYPWQASQGAPVLVGGQPGRVIGRVSMDMIAIDLRQAPDAKVGQAVELWGSKLPVEQVAEACGTIPWDLMCGVTRRVHFRWHAG